MLVDACPHESDYDTQNICEGKKDIDEKITANDLVTIACDTINLKIEAFCPTFPWRFDEFVVHDTEWVDLSAHNSPSAYFYSQCLQPTRKSANTYTFKTKQFALFVVVPATQWAEYEAFTEHANLAPSTSARSYSSEIFSEVTVPRAVARSTFMPTRLAGSLAEKSGRGPSLFLPTTSAGTHEELGPPQPTASRRVTKRGVVSPPPTARSPPRKIPAIMPFSSADRADILREALRFGGTSELNVSKGEDMDGFASIDIYHKL